MFVGTSSIFLVRVSSLARALSGRLAPNLERVMSNNTERKAGFTASSDQVVPCGAHLIDVILLPFCAAVLDLTDGMREAPL